MEPSWTTFPIPETSAFAQRAALARTPHQFYWQKPSALHAKPKPLDMADPDHSQLISILQQIKQQGGTGFVVGGYVRDQLLGISSKDIDVEVFGLDAEQLKAVLSEFGKVDLIGEQFGVFMLHGLDIDWSLPRQDSKSGKGHRGVSVHTDPGLSHHEAARRRDLTINALMWDPLEDQLIDPFGGLDDLQNGILRAVDEELFSDDPLRGLRAVRMSALFGFLPDDHLLGLMSKQDLSELSPERIWGEWEKICLRGRIPSLAFYALEESALIRYFPEIDALRDVQQDPHWHPEGDVYIHTAMVMDAACPLRNGDRSHDLALMLGALCHDLGKAPTTSFEDGRWRSKNHDNAGIPLTEQLLSQILAPSKLIKQVSALVAHHLKPVSLQKGNAGPAAYRRLARHCGDAGISMRQLAEVCEADHRGRTSEDAQDEEISYITSFMNILDDLSITDDAPIPLVQGRDLMTHGITPGKSMGTLLQRCFDYQLKHGETDKEKIIQAIL